MSLRQTVYFMALVGALAGLLCWLAQAFLSDVTFSEEWILILIYTTLMGALIGGLTVAFADHWTSDRVVLLWSAAGVLMGAVAGALSSLVYTFSGIPEALVAPHPGSSLALLGRTLAWVFAGTLIGLFTGVRWSGVNKLRALHAAMGGLFGGLTGGLVFSLLGAIGGAFVEVFQAFAFMITGVFITLGVTLAPVLLKDGVLQFVSSGDARAQNKYGSPRQEWLVQDGDSFVIGSMTADYTQTIYARGVQIYIPDALVAPRHAVLFAKKKHYYLQQHPSNVGPQGQPAAILEVGNDTVVGVRELRDGDDIILGQTRLRFLTRKSDSPKADVGRFP